MKSDKPKKNQRFASGCTFGGSGSEAGSEPLEKLILLLIFSTLSK